MISLLYLYLPFYFYIYLNHTFLDIHTLSSSLHILIIVYRSLICASVFLSSSIIDVILALYRYTRLVSWPLFSCNLVSYILIRILFVSCYSLSLLFLYSLQLVIIFTLYLYYPLNTSIIWYFYYFDYSFIIMLICWSQLYIRSCVSLLFYLSACILCVSLFRSYCTRYWWLDNSSLICMCL